MKFILFAITTLLVFSCSKENVPQMQEGGSIRSITVNVASFDCATKTAVSPSGAFTWSASDQIGIYPVASTLGAEQVSQQIVFKINGTGDASSSTFTGTGWGLITNGKYKYFSYYPYSASAEYDNASVSYCDTLNQVSNTSTAHLGVNDYLYASQIQPADAASAYFAFKHLSALVEFEITVPSDVQTKKFTRMTVTASEPVFTTSGNYDPSSATSTVAPTITNNDYTDKLNIKFNNGDGFTPDVNGKIHAYFLIAPAAVGGKTLSIKFWDEDNKVYIASKTPTTNIVSQNHKIYQCTATLKPATMVKNLSVNASDNKETANCYIVPEYGRYKFLANVRGNGVDPVRDDTEGPTIDMKGCNAEVIWETVNTNAAPAPGTIVNNSTITIEDNYIVFDATGVQGNALIALKNSSNQIVWSWHVWSTSADLEALKQTYPNDAGVSMDRNLGALSATPGDGLTLGFHYQWGRPFPITGGSATSTGEFSSTRMATTNSSVWVEEATDVTKGTLAYSASNPTHLIYGSASNYYKGQTSGDVSGNWLWTADANNGYESGMMPEFWGSSKTMYDPSPVGWKVPAGGVSGVWQTAGFDYDSFIWSTTNKGRTFTPSAVYYPAAGARRYEYKGSLGDFGTDGFIWSASVSNNKSYCLFFSSKYVNTAKSYQRSFGLSVRPVHE